MRPWTRRGFLALLGSLDLRGAPGQVFPADWNRYADPSTEFPVFRLTSPAYSSYLGPDSRIVSSRNNFLIFCSDRAGSLQAFRLDLKNGESRMLTQAQALEPSSLRLSPDERGLYYYDGPDLRYQPLSGQRSREIYGVAEPFQRGKGLGLSVDGRQVLVAENQPAGSARLRLIPLTGGAAITLVEAPGVFGEPMARPRRDAALYRRDDSSLWMVNFDRQQNHRLRIAGGDLGPARWAPDGRSVLYLNLPQDKAKLTSIREHFPDTGADTMVASTSQFASFAPNGDASVFVGASASQASPYILLLARLTQKELPMCEHRATTPMNVFPLFSPDSQRIFFQSDQHGKPAIYMLRVEKLVEKT